MELVRRVLNGLTRALHACSNIVHSVIHRATGLFHRTSGAAATNESDDHYKKGYTGFHDIFPKGFIYASDKIADPDVSGAHSGRGVAKVTRCCVTG